MIGREDFEKQNPAEVQKVVDTFVRAANWSSDEKNRSELFRIWARSGTPVTSWEADFNKQSLAVRNSPLLDEFLVSRYESVANDALKLKLIRRPVTIKDWFEPRYLNVALKQQGLEKRWVAFDAKGQSKADLTPVAQR